jgi:type IV pilus assembly protein PilW
LDDDGSPVNFTLKKRGCTGTPPTTVGTIADKRKFISNIYYIRDYGITPGDGIPTLMRSEFDLSGATLAHKTPEPLINGIEGFRVELGLDTLSDSGAAVNYAAAIAWANPDILTSPTNRGDGIPDSFVRCPLANVAADVSPPSTHPAATVCTAAQLVNVVAVKLYVLARAEKATPGYVDTKVYNLGTTALGPFNDGFKRHVFSTTVRLTNVSGRRETP